MATVKRCNSPPSLENGEVAGLCELGEILWEMAMLAYRISQLPSADSDAWDNYIQLYTNYVVHVDVCSGTKAKRERDGE